MSEMPRGREPGTRSTSHHSLRGRSGSPARPVRPGQHAEAGDSGPASAPEDTRDYIQRCLDPSFTVRCLRCRREVFFPSHLVFRTCPHCGGCGFVEFRSNHPDAVAKREAHGPAGE